MKSNKLKKYKEINHKFFNRVGGTSVGVYKSLNCGVGSNDNRICVKKNLSIVKKIIGCKENNLVLLNQQHSNKCHLIKEKDIKKKLYGDGFITKSPGVALGILTADCAPLLFYDRKIKMIGAAHAGWKGSYKNIMKSMINLFKKNNSNVKDLIVIIGPCISINNYQVKNNFLIKFLSKDQDNIKFFKRMKKSLYFNLGRFIKFKLQQLGVKKVEIIKKDTYEKKNNYFSARYSKKNNISDYGRNISIIMIK